MGRDSLHWTSPFQHSSGSMPHSAGLQLEIRMYAEIYLLRSGITHGCVVLRPNPNAYRCAWTNVTQTHAQNSLYPALVVRRVPNRR